MVDEGGNETTTDANELSAKAIFDAHLITPQLHW